MVDFTYTPSQYYGRIPSVNQNNGTMPSIGKGTDYNTYYGINPNGIGGYSGYNPLSTPPGTIGYRLPAQNYANYGINNPAYYGTPTLKTALVNTAINVGTNVVSNLLGLGGNSPSNNRLRTNNLNAGAVPSIALTSSQGSETAFADSSDTRVNLLDTSGLFVGASPVTSPLVEAGGIIFPYTPSIQLNHKATYDMQHLVHTNYANPMYQHSGVDSIGITAEFTAQTPAEAENVAAAIWFLRSVTKMFYGQDSIAGTPPPILSLNGHGPYLLNAVPVVVTSFDYTLPTDVDYISCYVNGEKQRIPSHMQMTISCIPTYSRNQISNKFGLTKYASGELERSRYGSGGFI